MELDQVCHGCDFDDNLTLKLFFPIRVIRAIRGLPCCHLRDLRASLFELAAIRGCSGDRYTPRFLSDAFAVILATGRMGKYHGGAPAEF